MSSESVPPCSFGPVDGTCEIKTLLVFALTPAALHTPPAELRGALLGMREYVRNKRAEGASLRVLHPDLAVNLTEEVAWQLATPDFSNSLTSLSAVHVFELAEEEDKESLVPFMRDDDQIAYVHHPAVRYPCARLRRSQRSSPDQWGLEKCGFHKVWQTLDVGCKPGPIAMIDQGRDEGHRELRQRIVKYVGPSCGDGSGSTHAGAVAAIMSAGRDDVGTEDMKGCCSADIHLYNPWSVDARFDACAYYRALRAVAERPVPVLNLSMASSCRDCTEENHIRVCLERGIIVVAAMGNSGPGNTPEYPAQYDGVIAVGATDESDVVVRGSTRGDHVLLCAPGDDIKSIVLGAGYDYSFDGTSFAAAFVSAAVWLALRSKPCLTPAEIRCLLATSVDPHTKPNEGHSPDMGHGRLDMTELVKELDRLTECI